MTGRYDSILGKQADVQYKILMARIALANERYEQNRLERIKLAVECIKLDRAQINLIEALILEDFDLSDQQSND